MMPPVGPGAGATPPIGSSPAAAPSPNPGSEAASMALVQQAIKILGQAAQKTDPGGELGQIILKSIQQLAKKAPAQQAAPGNIEMQALRNIAQQARQSAPLMALQRMQPQPMAAAPGGAAGGAPPMPSGEGD